MKKGPVKSRPWDGIDAKIYNVNGKWIGNFCNVPTSGPIWPGYVIYDDLTDQEYYLVSLQFPCWQDTILPFGN